MGDLFLKVLEMSYGASIVILIVMLIRVLLKKAPKIYSYMLWSVVLLRLIFPISIESDFSIIPSNNIISEKINATSSKVEKYNISNNQDNVVRANKESLENVDLEVLDIEVLEKNALDKNVFTNYNDDSFVLESDFKATYTKPSKSEQILFWLSSVWITGFTILLGYGIISLKMFKGRLHNVQFYRDNIYFADNISTAFILGIFAPKIYIPRNISENELEYIILHEQKHVKRWDYFIKIVSYVATCIHWFNPLVWLAYFKSTEDMEMSCDESVIRQMGSDIKKDYTNSLLTFATREYAVSMPLAFGEVSVKTRIKNVLGYKSVSVKVGIVLVIFVVITTGLLLLNPVTKTTLTEVVENEYEKVLLLDSVNNIYNLQNVYVVLGEYGVADETSLLLPKESKAEVVTFLKRIELQGKAKNYTKTGDGIILNLVGTYEGGYETVVENYYFNRDLTVIYVDGLEGETEAYEISNLEEVQYYFNNIYLREDYDLEKSSYPLEKSDEVVLDFEGFYNAKNSGEYNKYSTAIFKFLNMTPLGRTTVGDSISLTKISGQNGLIWNVKKTVDFDHVQDLTKSVLLIFILFDDIDFVDVKVDGVIEISTYGYERGYIDKAYGKDVREYGNSREALEEFITTGYKIDNLALTSSAGRRPKNGLDIPEDYKLEDAIVNGDFVITNDEMYNVEAMEKFIEDVNSEDVKKATVRSVNYNSKGQASSIMTFIYNDDEIAVIIDTSRNDYNSEEVYKILTFKPNIVTFVDEEYTGGMEAYYVTDLDEITREVLENSDGTEGAFLYFKPVK